MRAIYNSKEIIRVPLPKVASGLLSALSLLCGPAAFADFNADVGFTELQAELGAGLPDGNGVKVDQIEASFAFGEDFVWMPNPGSLEFIGKTINDVSGSHPVGIYSSHAGNVAALFYGLVFSAAPGIQTIDSFSAGNWIDVNFLRSQIGGFPIFQPAFTGSRVANHSWVGTTTSNNEDILARTDWVVETDDMLQVVGYNGSTTNVLMSNAYNVISVARTSQPTNGGTVMVGGVYQAGRTKPELMAPETSASNATPRVSATVALLVQAAHDNPAWSTDPAGTSTTNRNGDTIYNAERSEVIKAALMAGADRRTDNTWPEPPYALGNVDDYRALGGDQTTNGLDRRFGAGQLNMYNSYFIIAGSEQNSIEDDNAGGGQITNRGFDYDPAFGGSGGTNTQATYYLAQSADPIRLTASLVWNLDINGGSPSSFNGTGTLHNLDLEVIDVSDPGNPILVSASTNENTENLWILLDGGKDYALRVSNPDPGGSPFNWDYALAWQASPVPALDIQIAFAPPSGMKGQFYFWNGASASGGEPPYTWTLSSGWLPWQLALQSDGTIQGTPSEVTTTFFTLQLSDANGDNATYQSQLQIKSPVYICGSCHSAPDY